MGEQQASRTAVFVCQGRAVAHGRLAVGRFDDPTALALLRDGERAPVERARGEIQPRAGSHKMDVQLLGRQAEAMAVRTVAVDDAVRATANSQLVILGAGLDGRAWRMPELSGVDVFELDHPASQLDKRESRPTTWVLEGVIPYLSAGDVAATVAAVAARSAPGSRVVVSYQTPSSGAALGRLLARGLLRLSGRGDPMAHEPRRSSWTSESVRALLADAGLRITEDRDLRTVADELSVPDRHVGTSRVAVAAVSGEGPPHM